MKKLIITFIFLLAVLPCQGRIITVDDDSPADFNNIQAAINDSNDGDTIKVQPGVYIESINFYGKAITVTSANPNSPDMVASTIIKRKEMLPDTVVRFDCGEDNNSVLTGFTIQAIDSAEGTGFGVYCYYSSPVISNNVIFHHATGVQGESAYPTLVNNFIRNNRDHGIYDCDGTIFNCVISSNLTGLQHCDGEITKCIIENNGAFGLYECDGSIRNCVITSNGEGLVNCGGQITNCTIVYSGTGNGLQGCHGEIKNCIVAFNAKYGFDNCIGTIKYNNVWNNGWGNYAGGSLPGTGNIHADPLFVDAGNHNYRLKSETGHWDSSLNTWIVDETTSPCVDAGDPSDPTRDELYSNDIINQGAYGGTEEASKSPYQIIYCTADILGDPDRNCKVDFNDFAIMASVWLEGQIQLEFHRGVTWLSTGIPDLSGDIFVWEDTRDSQNHDIYGYNLTTDKEFPICTANGHQRSPAISGNIVVWLDHRGVNNHFIFGYDLSRGYEFPICVKEGADSKADPAIDDNIVVWADYRGPNWAIYGADITDPCNPVEFLISGSGQKPAISGNIVVWRSGTSIVGHNLSDKKNFPICIGDGYKEKPAIDANIVVWTDPYRSEGPGVYGYDLSTQTEFLIASGGMHPDVSGDIVVWTDKRYGEYDIYGYDVSARDEFPICIAASSQLEPVISGGTVVWRDLRGGIQDLYWRYVCNEYFAGDIKGDCRVDLDDFVIMASHWLQCNLHPPEACWE